MHYIRLLRPPSLVEGKTVVLSFVLTITTDLGDSYFSPDAALSISVTLETERGPIAPSDVSSEDFGEDRTKTEEALLNERHLFQIDRAVKPPSGKAQPLAWSSGMRVLKMGLVVPKEAAAELADPLVLRKRICFSMGLHHAAIVPLWVDVPEIGSTFPHVALRRLRISQAGGQEGEEEGKDEDEDEAVYVEVEEDIGESIARHVWDAGLATVGFLADTCMGGSRRQEADDGTLAKALIGLLTRAGSLHILELGSGVGILGIGLATILGQLRGQEGQGGSAVLLTDLAEAEERAVANIERASASAAASLLDYENLDWGEGCRGRFGAKAAAGQPWDLVVLSDCTYNVDVLPALVQTLSALQSASASAPLNVLLARKPRHPDEEALFGLMSADGWAQSASSIVSLPGSEREVLELYLYSK